MKVSREFRVGLVAIIALVLLYWGFNFLKGKDLFEKKRVFYAIYDEIDGLDRSRPVTINGFQVGLVEDIYFHPDGSARLIVKINMKNEIQISEGTVARIYSQDLLGGKSIELLLGISNTPMENGDTLTSDVQLSLTDEVNKQVAPIKAKAEKLLGSIDTVLILISGFLNDDTKASFRETFNSIRRSFEILENTVENVDETVAHSQQDLQSILRNLASITANLEENSESLSATFANAEKISDSLAAVNFKQTFESLNHTLLATEEVMQRINRGEGSLGLLINDKELYYNLESATEQLNVLVRDIKYNPKRYVGFSIFGNKQEYSQEEQIEMEKERLGELREKEIELKDQLQGEDKKPENE